MTTVGRVRSLLFCPENRLDKLSGTPGCSPDAIVFDLESPLAEDRDGVRRSLVEQLNALSAPTLTLYLRVNDVSSPWFDEDLALVESGALAGVILPQWENDEELMVLDTALSTVERHRSARQAPTEVLLLVESAAGIGHCQATSPPARVERGLALVFGANDYARDLGIDLDWSPLQLVVPRTAVAIAARRYGGAALDTAFPRPSLDELRRDARVARSLGFTGKLCVRPEQVPVVNDIFTKASHISRGTEHEVCNENEGAR